MQRSKVIVKDKMQMGSIRFNILIQPDRQYRNKHKWY